MTRPARIVSTSPLTTLCAVCCALISSVSFSHARPLDLNKLREDAKSAYAKGDFKTAQRSMAKVVQVLPSSASDYLMLARSAYSNKDHARASAAYSFYFQLNRRPEQRPKDEYKRVKSLVTAKKDKRFIEGSVERIKQVESLAERGELEGAKGALKALSRLRREGLFHPRLKRAYKAIQRALERAQEATLSQWWSARLQVDAPALKALDERWASWESSGLGEADSCAGPRAQLKAISLLRDRPSEALNLLKEVSQSAGRYELSQRHLLLVALARAGSTGEALELTRSLLTRARGADVERLSLLEAQLLAQVSQTAGQAPTEDQLQNLTDLLYVRDPSASPERTTE